MTWWLWALIASGFYAIFLDFNRRWKMEPVLLNAWRALTMAVVLAPITLFMEWPTHPLFYGAAVFLGVALFIGINVQFWMAKKHNGRVAALTLPIEVVGMFALWLVIDDAQRQALFAQPMVLAAVVGIFVVMTAALLRFRSNDITRDLVPIILFLGAIFVVMNVLVKAGLATASEPFGAVAVITLVQSAVFAVLSFGWQLVKKQPMWEPKLVKAVPGLAGVHLAYSLCLNMGFFYTPNPGYIAVFILLAPVWLLFYHKLAGIPDSASPVAGTVLVVAAMVLLLVTS